MRNNSSLVNRKQLRNDKSEVKSNENSSTDSKDDKNNSEDESREVLSHAPGASISEALQIILNSRRAQSNTESVNKASVEDEIPQEPPATVFQLMG